MGMDRKIGHGGARAGAGRKKKNSGGKIKACYSLSSDVVEFLRDHEKPASRLIEDAVREFYKINSNNA